MMPAAELADDAGAAGPARDPVEEHADPGVRRAAHRSNARARSGAMGHGLRRRAGCEANFGGAAPAEYPHSRLTYPPKCPRFRPSCFLGGRWDDYPIAHSWSGGRRLELESG